MIKTLYANGDSWTFGQELRDDAEDHLTYKFYNTWPWHLAQHLQIPQLVNDSLGGTSNYRIFRKTLDYIQNYKGNYNELLVIVAWTTYERREVPVVIPRQLDNGHTKWEQRDIEYIPVLMNDTPHAKTGDPVVDKTVKEWHKNIAMLDDKTINAKIFYNQQWLLKQTCENLGVNLLQLYALDNPEFVEGSTTANNNWLEHIKPYPISLNRILMAIEHVESVRAPLRHPNELGHKYIAEQLQQNFKDYTSWSIECPY